MFRYQFFLLLLLVIASVAKADPPTFPAVSNVPPHVASARLVGDVLIVAQDTVQSSSIQAFAPEDYRILDLEGKLVDSAVAAQRLKRTSIVLVSNTGKRVDPVHLQLYKPGIWIIYLRPQRVVATPAAVAPPRAAPVPSPAGAPST